MAESKDTASPEKQSPSDDLSARDKSTEDLSLESERKALKKAREGEGVNTDAGEGAGGYENLHFGDQQPLEAKEGFERFSELEVNQGSSHLSNPSTRTSADPANPNTVDPQDNGAAQSSYSSSNNPFNADANAFNGLATSNAPKRFGEEHNEAAQQNGNAPASNVAGSGNGNGASGAASDNNQSDNRASVNEPPTDIELSSNFVAENEEGAVIGTLSSSDPDSFESAQYSIAYDPSGYFEIVDGQLKLKDGVSLDHESQDSYEIALQVEDKAGNTYTETVSISVGDVNEAPTNLQLSATSVDENATGAVVGQLSLSDEDTGDSHIFEVSDDRFEVVDGQLKLKDGVALNHEETASVDVTVTAFDAGGLSTEQTFSIDVGDVNEAPTNLQLSATSVDENADGAIVGQLSLSDVDTGDSHIFEVSDDRFEVVDGQFKAERRRCPQS